MLELQPNIWINPEHIVSMQKNSSKITGEIKLFLRMSNGEQYDIIDNDGAAEKKILKVLK